VPAATAIQPITASPAASRSSAASTANTSAAGSDTRLAA
jgi:hypothetical protein